jgi:hypothetical protein
MDLDLYKFYLGMIVKVSAFVFGTTGAIVSFFCVNAEKQWMLGALAVPIVLNVGAAVILLGGVGPAHTLHQDHQASCAKAGLTPPYDLSALPRTLAWLGGINVFIAVGLALLAVMVYQHGLDYFPQPPPANPQH